MNNSPNQTENIARNQSEWLSRNRALTLVLLAITAIALYICYLLALPFISSIMWASALAVVAFPFHSWLLSKTSRPNLAAGISVLVIGVAVAAPGVFLGQTLVSQISKTAQTLKTQTAAEQWENTVESNPKLASIINQIGPYFDVRGVGERAADAAASQVTSFVGGLAWIAAQLVITFFTLFYLLRDKLLILKAVKSLMPLSQSETDKLFFQVSNTIYATVYGTFSVSLAQGALGGLMFWWLGLPAPLLWGTVMFLLSLIPVLGAPVVWLPVTIYLAITGDGWKALILASWGLFVIGSIDNLLYPVVVGDRMKLHPLLVFFSVIGGLVLIGAAGLVLGPVIVVITRMLIDVWRSRTSEDQTAAENI